MKKSQFQNFIPLVSIFFIFVVNLTMIVYSHTSWNNSMNKYIPLKHQVSVLSNNLSRAHLWLEEAISGDPYVDIEKDVMIPFRHEKFHAYLANIDTILKAKEDEQFNEQLYILGTLLDSFYDTAQERWSNSKEYGIGSALDQKFDTDFNNIIKKIKILSLEIDTKLSNELEEKDNNFIVILTLFLLVNITIFTMLLVARKREKEKDESLFEANEKAMVTLRCIGDAVVTTDRDGNITFINEITEKLIEYSNEEVNGLHIDNVLNLINIKSGQKIVTPIHDVLHNNLTKLISNGTKLISKTGIEYIISDSAASIKDMDGKIVGTVLVFQDDTKDHRAQEELYTSNELNKTLNERMELALIGNSDGLWDWNIRDNSVYYSPLWKEMLGYSDDELPNEFATWETRVHADDLQNTLDEIQKNINRETKYLSDIHRLKHKDGHWVWILCRGKTQYDENNKPIRMIGTHTDISKNKETEREFSLQYNLLHNIINTVAVRIFWKDSDGVFLGANKLFLGDAKIDSLEGILGKSDFEMPWGETQGQAYRTDDLLVMETGKARLNYEEVQTDDDGENIILLTSKIPLRDADDTIIGILGSYVDITRQRRTEESLIEQKLILDHQAHHDALTGLANRVLFNDRLEQAIAKAKRSNKKFALFFIDLDDFKEINDSLGHVVGDEILKATTQRLHKTLRDKDSIARLGGDEFTVIVEDLEVGQDASLLAQKILEAINQPIDLEHNILYVSASIGICIYPDDGSISTNLVKYADAAMYRAKDEGRNNFQFYSSEMTELAFERVIMETSFREALENKDFIVYYQPQVDARTDGIIGMEALVRWQHSAMGIVLPGKFIPLAESTGLIVELDQWVMRTAMTQVVKWYDEGLNPGVIALNLSIKQLKGKDFIVSLDRIMKETKCKAEWIELEVTEGQIMTNPQEAIKVLNAISERGIELAVDDFGTGYSSLSYLKRLPINKLKIDQSFVKGLPDDEEDAVIAQAVIALAKSLKLRIIAEGVEREEQKEFLINNGCNNIQGYHYAKPMPAEEMKIILTHGF